MSSGMGTKSVPRAVREQQMLDAAERLPSFERPALVVWASQDRVMPPEHGHDAIKTLLASTALMVVNSGLPPGRAMIMRCMMVGKRGFEPPAPASRRQCSTRLSYSPTGTRAPIFEDKAREPRRGLPSRDPSDAQATGE